MEEFDLTGDTWWEKAKFWAARYKFQLWYNYYGLRYKFPFRQINTVKWFLHDLIWPKQAYIMNGVRRSWQDKPELLSNVMFNFVTHLVEKEEYLKYEYEKDDSWFAAREFFKDCYDYIKVRRPALQKEIETELDRTTTIFKTSINKLSPYREGVYKTLDELEKELEDKDNRYLTKIIEYRNYMWT